MTAIQAINDSDPLTYTHTNMHIFYVHIHICVKVFIYVYIHVHTSKHLAGLWLHCRRLAEAFEKSVLLISQVWQKIGGLLSAYNCKCACNTGADVDNAISHGILRHEGYCSLLLQTHDHATLRFNQQEQISDHTSYLIAFNFPKQPKHSNN